MNFADTNQVRIRIDEKSPLHQRAGRSLMVLPSFLHTYHGLLTSNVKESQPRQRQHQLGQSHSPSPHCRTHFSTPPSSFSLAACVPTKDKRNFPPRFFPGPFAHDSLSPILTAAVLISIRVRSINRSSLIFCFCFSGHHRHNVSLSLSRSPSRVWTCRRRLGQQFDADPAGSVVEIHRYSHVFGLTGSCSGFAGASPLSSVRSTSVPQRDIASPLPARDVVNEDTDRRVRRPALRFRRKQIWILSRR